MTLIQIKDAVVTDVDLFSKQIIWSTRTFQAIWQPRGGGEPVATNLHIPFGKELDRYWFAEVLDAMRDKAIEHLSKRVAK